MNTSKIIRNLAAMALAIAIVPSAFGQEKKTVLRTLVVKDGQVVTSDGPKPHVWRVAPRGFLGVQMIDLTPELREHYRVQKDAGVLVSKVVPDSPAAKAGIRVGDIITAVDGNRIDSPEDVARAVRDKKKGDGIRIDYSRGGANVTATANIVERERKEIDLSDLDIQIPDVATHIEGYFNSPEWKSRMERLQHLPDCGQLEENMRRLETKMRDLEKRMSQK